MQTNRTTTVKRPTEILHSFIRACLCCCCKDPKYHTVTATLDEPTSRMPEVELSEIPNDLPLAKLFAETKPELITDSVIYKFVDPNTRRKYKLIGKSGQLAYDRQSIRSELIARLLFARVGLPTMPANAYIHNSGEVFLLMPDMAESTADITNVMFEQPKNLWQLQDSILVNMLIGLPGQNLQNWYVHQQKDEQIVMQFAHFAHALGSTSDGKRSFLPEIFFAEICNCILNSEKTAAANPGYASIFDCNLLVQAPINNNNPFAEFEVLLASIKDARLLQQQLDTFAHKVTNDLINEVVAEGFHFLPVSMSDDSSEQELLTATLMARRNFILQFFELLLKFHDAQPSSTPVKLTIV